MSDGKLLFDTKIDASGFKKGLSSLGSLASSVGRGISKSLKIASTAVLGLGAFSVKTGMDFGAAMSEVEAISGATGDDLLALRSKAKEMGATTKFSATQSAEALKYMGMAGWKSQEMLDGLPGVMNLAAASGEDLGLVSDIVTDSLTAFGLKAKDTGRFVDVLAAASTASNTNVSMLGESFKYVAPVAGALGYKVEDVSVALGLMANAGIKGSQAGTSLKSALSRLSAPTKQVQEQMNALGISITDSNGEIKPFNQLIGDMRQSFKGLSEEQKVQAATTLFGKESMAGMLAILNASDDDFDKLTDSIYNSAGAAEEMARIMNDNLKGDITILQSALEGLGISLFENVDTPFRQVVQSVTKQVDRLNDVVIRDIGQLPKVIGDIIAEGAVAIAGKAPKFIEVGKTIILSLLDGLQENSDKLSDSAVKIALSLVNAFADISVKFIEVGLDIITNIGRGLADNADKITGKALQVINRLLSAFLKAIPDFLKIGLDIVKGIAKGIAQNPREAISAVGKIVTAMTIAFGLFKGKKIATDMIKSLVLGLSGNTSMIKSAGTGIVGQLIKAIGLKGVNMRLSADLLMNHFKGGLLSKVDGLKSAGASIVGKLVTGLSGAFGMISSVAAKIIPIITAVLSNPIGLVAVGALLIGAIIKGFDIDVPKIAHSAGEVIGKIAKTIASGAKKLFNSGKEIVSKISKGFGNGVEAFLKDPLILVKKIASLIIGGAKKLVKAGKSLIKGISDGWNGDKSKIEEDAKEIPENVNNAIESGDTKKSGQSMVQGVVQGLKEGATDISTAYKDLISNGVSSTDAKAILRQDGKASIDEYVLALIKGSEDVKGAYTALRTSGLTELEASEKFFEVAGLNINGYVNGTEEGGITYKEKIQEFMNQGFTELEAVEKTYEIAKKNIQGYTSGVTDSTEQIQTEFKTMLDIGLTELDAFEEMYAKGQLNVNAFGTGSAQGKEQIYATYQSLINAGLTPMNAIEQLQTMGLANAQGFADGSSMGLEPIHLAYKALSDAGLQQADIRELLRQAGYSNVDAYVQALNEGKINVGESYEGLVQDPLTLRSSMFDTSYQQDGKAKSDNFATGITLGKEGVNTSAESIRETALDTIGKGSKQAKTSGSEISENVATGITFKKDNVESSMEGVETSIKTSLDGAKNQSKSSVNSMMDGMSSSVRSGSSKINSEFRSLSNNINNSTKSTNRAVSSNGKQMMSNFTNAIKSGAGRAKSTISSMCSSMVSTVNRYRGSFSSAGYNLMAGLSSGIYDGRSGVIMAATNVMRSAVIAAKRAADIHSPSRVARKEIGQMWSVGLGYGIQDKMKFVKDKAKNVMDSLVEKAQADVKLDLATATAGGYSSNFVFSGYDKSETDVRVTNGDITTYVELDGKVVGKSVAPIVSQEISKDKRRRK